MFQVLAVMFILILLGVIFRLCRLLPRDAAGTLNRFVLYVAFPSLVFRSLQPSELTSALWGIPPLTFLIVSLTFVLTYFISQRSLRLPPLSAASFAMGAAFGNTAFLGYPFILALRGEAALPAAIFFDQMGNFLSVFSVGIAFCLFSRTGRFSLHNLREILKLPPFLAFLLALASRSLAFPPLFWDIVNRLADTTIPLIMVAIGLSLSATHLSQNLKPVLAAAALKLVVLPLLFVLATRFLPFPTLLREVMILQAATPTLLSSYALADAYQLDLPLSSSIIFLTTVLSLITLPLWSLLIAYL
ncbi:MAG TPA: AEC family transporter [Atribacteraceae bacterium]|nr:AEC family transporter [Atribacteraceae bacterium]